MSGETQQAEGKKDNTNPLLNQDIKAINDKLDAIGSVVNNRVVQTLLSPLGQEGLHGALVMSLKAQGKNAEADVLLNRKPPDGIIQQAGRFITHSLEKPQTGADILVKGAATGAVVVAYDYTAAKMGWELPRPGWFESAEEEVVSSKRR